MIRGLKILVVEDEETLADNIRTYLHRADCNVRCANNVHVAMAQLQDFSPDIVIVDYHLPVMNGFETLNVLRGRCSRCGCILITGHPSDEINCGLRSHGIREVLFKPFSLEELSNALGRDCGLAPPACSETASTDRRTNDRRRSIGIPFFPLRLDAGGWLFADRRRTDRRQATGSSDRG